MKAAGILTAALMLILVTTGSGLAEFKPGTGSISGYMVGEYYYVAEQHDCEIEGRHGFWFRRIYFTYNNSLADSFNMRLRLEMNSSSDFESS